MDDTVFSELSEGLSGGDILNRCLNAIHARDTQHCPLHSCVRRFSQSQSPAEVALGLGRALPDCAALIGIRGD